MIERKISLIFSFTISESPQQLTFFHPIYSLIPQKTLFKSKVIDSIKTRLNEYFPLDHWMMRPWSDHTKNPSVVKTDIFLRFHGKTHKKISPRINWIFLYSFCLTYVEALLIFFLYVDRILGGKLFDIRLQMFSFKKRANKKAKIGRKFKYMHLFWWCDFSLLPHQGKFIDLFIFLTPCMMSSNMKRVLKV